MEDQDKIFEHPSDNELANQLKSAARKAESKEFPAMEKVWNRVEEKLDKKEDRKVIALWKKLAIAASLLLFLSLGYQFFKSDIKTPDVVPQNAIVISEKDSVGTPNPIVKSEEPNPIMKQDAGKILQRQLLEKTDVVANESDDDLKDKETSEPAAANAFQRDVIESDGAKNIPEASAESMGKSVKAETVVTTDLKTGLQTITGIVSDETGPLPGANVIIKGTTIAIQTDYDGRFTIQAKKGDVLMFGFVGMGEGVATVGDKTSINMKLANSTQLQEVVVTGYKSVSKKSAVAYSTTTITSETITKENRRKEKKTRDGDKPSAANSNVSAIQSLSGKVAGLEIQSNPGTRTDVVVRGISSANSVGEPLYIIDGKPSSAEEFRKLIPQQIKSIDVLKDSSATALYGSRAANGAIIISTKHSSPKELRKQKRALRKAKKNPQTQIVTPHIEVSDEDYDSFIENPFESPRTAPLSTFSIDVDNASYTNIRRFINDGQTVPKDAVRVEEMVNFFKYQYPQPTDSNPFSINSEYSECPWNAKHKLLRIGLQGKNIATENLPASNLVFLIDVSGSMSATNKLPLLTQSMKILVNELREKDKVAIVVYAGAAGMVLPPTSGNEKKTIIEALELLNAGGSTAGGAGIELAYKLAQENFIKDGNNRVVLATDGDFNVGNSSNADMQTLIEEKRKTGVFLTCLGFGMGNYKDSKMEILSDKGNGNYAYIDNIQEANRFLGKEFKGSMFAIAKDVKIQIEFNPYYVQSYRLIGYENRKLRAEDFKNDAVDAGELGSGHTVTALYEVIPAGVKSKFLTDSDELKFTKSEPMSANFNNQLAYIKFRYKKPDGDKSIEMEHYIKNDSAPITNSSSDFKFSAAVAWFGLKLRDSKLVANKSSDDIKKLAQQGLSNDLDGYKAEFIRLVETVK